MKIIPQKKLSEIWLKASVVGSLWAVVEIVIGSLLHNLKLPLAGSILSFFSVFLIVAFFQIWKQPGMIWRAGLICAIMKSISPGAIIIGPMIGIFLEALILDLSIRIFGKNMVAYTVGGALAVFSALVHKLVSWLILYGWDLVVVFENMTQFAFRQLKFEQWSPAMLLLAISIIYLFTGGIAALLGYLAGKDYLRNGSEQSKTIRTDPEAGLERQVQVKGGYSVWALVLVPVFLVLGMIVISRSELSVALLFSGLFSGIIVWRYPANMRFLKKTAFWFQLVLILLFSALFYNGFSVDGFFKPEGWIAGIKMFLRALLVMAAFSAISREIKNPFVRNLMGNQNLRTLYLSLELAFSVLPGLIADSTVRKQRSGNIGGLVRHLLGYSSVLLDHFIKLEQTRPTIFIVTGPVHSGKSTFLANVVTLLQKQSLAINGFVTHVQVDVDGLKRYVVEDLITGQKQLLCADIPQTGPVRTGRFSFYEQGLSLGETIINRQVNSYFDLLVVDEIGPLELKDQGWAPSLDRIFRERPVNQLWVVRERLLSQVMRRWPAGDVYVFDIRKTRSDRAVETIVTRCCSETVLKTID